MKMSIVLASILSTAVSASQVIAESLDTVRSLSTPGTTKLVVFRSRESTQTATMNYRLFIDGKHIGKLKVGDFYALEMMPGDHTLKTNDRGKTAVDFVLRENHTLVYRANVLRDLSVELAEMSAEQALAEAPQLADELQTVQHWAVSPRAGGNDAGGE